MELAGRNGQDGTGRADRAGRNVQDGTGKVIEGTFARRSVVVADLAKQVFERLVPAGGLLALVLPNVLARHSDGCVMARRDRVAHESER